MDASKHEDPGMSADGVSVTAKGPLLYELPIFCVREASIGCRCIIGRGHGRAGTDIRADSRTLFYQTVRRGGSAIADAYGTEHGGFFLLYGRCIDVERWELVER